MIDPMIQRLLENAIDSPIKLQLLLLFCDNRHLEGTAAEIAARIYRDIWSTREALHELAEDGILVASDVVGETMYRYRPCPEYIEPIARLYKCYNEPLERDLLQSKVRESASYASYLRTARRTIPFEHISNSTLVY